MVFKRLCAWCGRSLGSKECQCTTAEPGEEQITHSICPACQAKVEAEIQAIKINNDEHSQGEA
jgi:CRISPR/Cas system-associated protein Cas10 (large subunit of type III CRISPR-Cas system)